jgi:transcriptional regulator with XRE-family HTH domain
VSDDERLEAGELEEQSNVWALVGEMIASTPRLAVKPSRNAISISTALCAELHGEGKILSLSNKCKFPKQTIGNWLRGESVPQLDSLIRLCRQVGISPFEFVTESLTSESFHDRSGETKGATGNKLMDAGGKRDKAPRRHEKLNLCEAERILKAALSEIPPPSQVEVARRFDRQPNTLRYHFPEWCKTIAERHAAHRHLCRREKWEKARNALLYALSREVPPTVADVARQGGWHLGRLIRRFPDLCKALAVRFKRWRAERWKRLESSLKLVLIEQPPPPMYEVVKRFGLSASTLYKYFPDLCRKVGKRHMRYRKELFDERRKKILASIRKAALMLYAEGIYPSVKTVERQLEKPITLRSSAIGLQLLREIRDELNLSSRSLHPTRF